MLKAYISVYWVNAEVSGLNPSHFKHPQIVLRLVPGDSFSWVKEKPRSPTRMDKISGNRKYQTLMSGALT